MTKILSFLHQYSYCFSKPWLCQSAPVGNTITLDTSLIQLHFKNQNCPFNLSASSLHPKSIAVRHWHTGSKNPSHKIFRELKNTWVLNNDARAVSPFRVCARRSPIKCFSLTENKTNDGFKALCVNWQSIKNITRVTWHLLFKHSEKCRSRGACSMISELTVWVLTFHEWFYQQHVFHVFCSKERWEWVPGTVRDRTSHSSWSHGVWYGCGKRWDPEASQVGPGVRLTSFE